MTIQTKPADVLRPRTSDARALVGQALEHVTKVADKLAVDSGTVREQVLSRAAADGYDVSPEGAGLRGPVLSLQVALGALGAMTGSRPVSLQEALGSIGERTLHAIAADPLPGARAHVGAMVAEYLGRNQDSFTFQTQAAVTMGEAGKATIRLTETIPTAGIVADRTETVQLPVGLSLEVLPPSARGNAGILHVKSDGQRSFELDRMLVSEAFIRPTCLDATRTGDSKAYLDLFSVHMMAYRPNGEACSSSTSAYTLQGALDILEENLL